MGNILRISEHSFLIDRLPKNPTVVDLGACSGEFMYSFLDIFPDASYVAVEANPKLYEILNSANSRANVSIVNAIVMNKNRGIINFNIDPNDIHNSSAIFEGHKNTNHEWEKFRVRSIGFFELIKKIEHIHLLKVDIEGAEWDIVELFEKSTYDKVDQISIEFHDFIDPMYGEKTENCVQKLLELGYKAKFSGTTMQCGSKYYDCLFYK